MHCRPPSHQPADALRNKQMNDPGMGIALCVER